jgi:hypothetical protein
MPLLKQTLRMSRLEVSRVGALLMIKILRRNNEIQGSAKVE